MKVKVYNIDWETDDEEWNDAEELEELGCAPNLPSEMMLDVPSDEIEDCETQREKDIAVEEWISDRISDETGFLHNGFEWEYAK